MSHRNASQDKTTALFDWEIECIPATGPTEIKQVGYAASAEDAFKRLCEIHKDRYVTMRASKRLKAHCPTDVQINELSSSWDVHGRYVLADDQSREAYAEHGGGHIKTAFEFLIKDRPKAQWKTVKMLTALRQAFREDSVNGHEFYINWLFKEGPSKRAVESYLCSARSRDARHHGQNTF